MSVGWKSLCCRVAVWVVLLATGMAGMPDAEARTARKAEASSAGKRAVKKAPAARQSAASAKNRPAARVLAAQGKSGRVASLRRAPRVVEPAVMSVGALSGLHAVDDPLDLKSGSALVVDQDSNQVLFSKNPTAVLPIASITKLMTALVVVEAQLPLSESLSIDQADVEETQGSRSRLLPGTALTRGDLLRLALMSSENRAAHALSRHYPGGSGAFVAAMNQRARQLGMHDTRFVESTGLSAENRSSAEDLVRLINAAAAHEVIRSYSTSKESLVPVGSDERLVHYRSTNGLIGNPEWEISLQKTGYIAAAGRCLVMQAQLAGRRLTMVLLDSAGKYSRFGDAERIRKWLNTAGEAVVQTAVHRGAVAPAASLTTN